MTTEHDWKRLHDAVNAEIGKRIKATIEIKHLHKQVNELERELGQLREFLSKANLPTAHEALRRWRGGSG